MNKIKDKIINYLNNIDYKKREKIALVFQLLIGIEAIFIVSSIKGIVPLILTSIFVFVQSLFVYLFIDSLELWVIPFLHVILIIIFYNLKIILY